MTSTRLQIASFCVLGIYRTEHGSALARALHRASVLPRFALISAEQDSQLRRSEAFWNHSEIWQEASTLLDIHKDGCVEDAGTIEQYYQHAGVPYLFVPGFESNVTLDLLNRAQVDCAVLAEAPIMKQPILDVFPQGVVNLHAAPLPGYRGNNATWWALYHDEPLEVCAHLISRGIDDGPILGRRSLPVLKGDTLEDIDRRGFEVCGELAVQIIQNARNAGIPFAPQMEWQGRTFRGPMPQDIIDECQRRLQAGEYSHYS